MDISALEPFVGEWKLETSLPAPEDVRARAIFEWVLGGAFLLERSEISVPEAPDGLCVFAANAGGDGFTQHYFDSRGVVRVYKMTLENGIWTLLRDEPDFTPLSFHQRYHGEFTADGNAIEGRWESSPDGHSWELDFELNYIRTS